MRDYLIYIIIGVGIIAAILYLYLSQRNLIYFPAKETPLRSKFFANDMQIISLKTQDNIILHSWYKVANTHQPTILFLHGNSGHIGHRMSLIRQFLKMNFGVLLLEYRGYGGNTGSPSETGLYYDAQAGFLYLLQQGISNKNIVIYGESLGTGVATKLASENPVCAVILQSPYTSLNSMARYHYPWLFIKPWDQFNSLERIKQIHAPLLIIHGKLDKIVPYSDGLILFNHANQPKKLLDFSDKHHNDLWNENFYKQTINFIQNNC